MTKSYHVHLFVQGRGWRVLREVYSHSGVLASFEEARKLALYVILVMMKRAGHPYGSREGDVVGFRVEDSEEEPEHLPEEARQVDWEEHKHRFFKRGEAYMMYKTWSWPD
ncbi:MAG TPA: hypothetical protein EYP20_05810 [Aigarchaeota archaeon]|nr:hypothetical protein [Aigarchaeota archaeon]